MAKNNQLFDIQIRKTSAAYSLALNSTVMEEILRLKAIETARLYQAQVARKTMKLHDSVQAEVRPNGGQDNDRLVADITVGGPSVVSTWNPGRRKTDKKRKNGKGYGPISTGEFFYGVYHEEGNKGKGRSKKRGGGGRDGAHELRQVAHQMRGTP